MFTFLWVVSFGVIGAFIGNLWFGGAIIAGGLIGALIGLILRFMLKFAARADFDFGDFSGFGD